MSTQAVSIPYFDLKRQYQNLKNELESAFTQTAASGAYILSEKVKEFESAFAAYCGTRFAVGVGSGTDALIFSLLALGIGKGHEVIVPSYTFSASAFAIVHAGATPVFVDVDPETYTMDPRAVEKAISRRTKAILPVHLYGQAADMDCLLEIAKKKKLKMVEDACQAHGALWKDRRVGSLGDTGCFSFYPTKNLGAMGDGGMVVTNDEKLAEKIKRFRNLGRVDLKEAHKVAGWTSRLDALQAVVLQVKLQHLEDFNHSRRRVASRYMNGLQNTPLVLPKESVGRYHVYHLFVVRAPKGKRNGLQNHLSEAGIPTLVHYSVPCHKQPALVPFAKKNPKLPMTDQVSQEILSLPIFPEMTDQEVDRVCEVIRDFYRREN